MVRETLYVPVILLVASMGAADEPTQKTDLRVGIFKYLPDAASALERFEQAFETSEHGAKIDVDFELFDPYESADDPAVIRDSISKFDVVEIDLVRLRDLLQGEPVIERLPDRVILSGDQFVSAAESVVDSVQGRYLLPHWVCGQYFVFWKVNEPLEAALSFDQILTALDYGGGRPLLADLAGSTGLGEFYADAVLDSHGEQYALDHLKGLPPADSISAADLDPTAVNALRLLVSELQPAVRASSNYFHDYAPEVFPLHFARNRHSALLGYSERLYYVQRELSRSLNQEQRSLKVNELIVRQMSFAHASRGTPTWVDGFVIPKGRLADKGDAITCFLEFTFTEAGYLPFIVPSAWPATSSYLLPAHAAGYSDSLVDRQPIIEQYRSASSNPMVINESDLWRSIRRAGKVLESELGIQ